MKTPLILVGTLSLLLCACQSNIGECIRTSEKECKVAVVMQPNQQIVYSVNENLYAMEIDEWKATTRPPLVKAGLYLNGDNRYSYLEKTSKTHWIARYRNSPQHCWFTRALSNKPNLDGATQTTLDQVDSSLIAKSRFKSKYDNTNLPPDATPSTGQSILAAPFDYFIDPVASVVGTTIFLTVGAIEELITAPYFMLQQNKGPEPVAPNTNAPPDDWD